MPDSDISIVESCEKFFSERVPHNSGTDSGLGFLGLGGRGFFSDGFDAQVDDRFFTVASEIPDFDSGFSGGGDPL